LIGLTRLSHPFPSLLNGLATAAIALVAGADAATAVRVGTSMVSLQVSIGSVNDLADIEFDRVAKPSKPIPAGLVTPSVARAWAAGSMLLSLLLAAPSGIATVVVAVLCVSLGYVYDVRLSRTALSWLPLALALPLLPVFAWLGATGEVPRGLVALVPIAMLAGGALLVGNGIVDVERDAEAGKATVAVRLGRRRAWLGHAGAFLVAVIAALLLAPQGASAAPPSASPAGAWLEGLRGWRTMGVPLGGLITLAGVALLGAARPGVRERGWELEGIGTAVVGLGWLAGIALVEAAGA
jgi:4-hydroxybenzoate polyprenyltransferase